MEYGSEAELAFSLWWLRLDIIADSRGYGTCKFPGRSGKIFQDQKRFQTKTISHLQYILSLRQPQYKLALGCGKPCKKRHYPVNSKKKHFM
jgi:hypothetical protein